MFYIVGGTTFSESENQDEEDKSTEELLLTLEKINPILARLETS